MKINFQLPYATVSGRTDGAVYWQGGIYFDTRGESMSGTENATIATTMATNEPTYEAAVTIYTKEDLERLLENQGIKGLRRIGDKYGVKSRSSEELITEILEAQAKANDPENLS
ncbi:hypothetical protein KCM76_22985 [Zooshikella marina]|uniref:Rho termination factor N-terminal domain-containing protein n=1 Tax=Zooshikella ganghwensis TaxID=202772 RepID=UPI001BB0D062|nr:Rho termination factor N-terminal domain-containing protein [Zooshikella ganghwensis]MBU2708878.1 hypothetical protein [Zooshikella ganghwensis]